MRPDQDTGSLPDGTDVRAWKLRADGSFAASGVEAKEMTVWMGDDHRVAATQQTAAFGDAETTTVQQFTAWGEPAKIEGPKG